MIQTIEGPSPYRAVRLLKEGERFQIAAGKDEKGNTLVLRAIHYGAEASSGEITGRRLGLRRQYEYLEALGGRGKVPRAIDWLMLEESPVEPPPEPLLVEEYIEGTSLFEYMEKTYPEGMAPEEALKLLDGLSDLVAETHKQKWLLRDFDPRRFLLNSGGELCLVSTGSVVKMGAPLDETQLSFHPAYVAPEIRDELTGSMQRPTADLYGMGCLLSFLVTGEEPREQVESPLSFNAYERLKKWELPGLELLIARLLQPLAKKRIGRAERLKTFLSLEDLPRREDRGFEMTMLPAPWLGLNMENPESNRGLRSSLSPGPLVSIGRGSDQPAEKAQVQKTPEEMSEGNGESSLHWQGILIFVVLILLALAYSFLFSSRAG